MSENVTLDNLFLSHILEASALTFPWEEKKGKQTSTYERNICMQKKKKKTHY